MSNFFKITNQKKPTQQQKTPWYKNPTIIAMGAVFAVNIGVFTYRALRKREIGLNARETPSLKLR